MNERERFEALLVVLADLREANRATPILVEGQRDVTTLRALGCAGIVRPVHNGSPLFEVAEQVGRAHARVIVFTDWDRKGKAICEQLMTSLQANGVSPDTTYRDRVRSSVKLSLKDVEALLPYVTRGLARFHRQTLEDHHRGLALG